MKHLRLLTAIAATVLLAACGGGGNSPAAAIDPDARAELPASAGASLPAFHTTLTGLADDERANPLGLDQLLAPTSDTADPQPLD